jgi:glutamate--cysteine ligase
MLSSHLSFPRLKTAHQGPLSLLETHVLSNSSKIEAWFQKRWLETPALITTSVDLRHAGFKISPVDTNLFPAGFNNLHADSLDLCVQALQLVISERMPECRRIVVIPENHTRNAFYLQSLWVLQQCLVKAGFLVHLGSLDPELTEAVFLETAEGHRLCIEPLIRKDNKIWIGHHEPCLLILNHDLSAGIPDILKNLNQPIFPGLDLGWGSRLKSSHFLFFNQVIDEFSELIDVNSWLINPIFCAVSGVDFMQQTGLEPLAHLIDKVIAHVRVQYQTHGITERPFVAVKADNGTYGMSVMMVHEGKQMLQLNRKQRTKMATRKGGQKVSNILIQEGVYSIETMLDQAVAEPVIYLIGSKVVGGFYRIHEARGSDENLNTPGMYFKPMAFESVRLEAYDISRHQDISNRFYVYGVIARLAALAAAREHAAIVF